METNDNTIIPVTPEQEPGKRNTGRILAGLVVIGVGTVLLSDRLGYYIPQWVFTWKMLLIVIGLFIGAKHSFKGGKWLIPIAVGAFFLISELPAIDLPTAKIFWPVIIIIIGIMMIVKPKKNRREHWGNWRNDYYTDAQNSSEDIIETVTIFGSLKKNVISKQFKGGESVCVFGGTELNMMQADINGRIVLEIVQVFGGTKIVVPSNWQVQSEEMVSIFGGLEDKRPLSNTTPTDNSKVLVLRGTCLFGGINLKSY